MNWEFVSPEISLFCKLSKMISPFGWTCKSLSKQKCLFWAQSPWHVTTHKSHVLATSFATCFCGHALAQYFFRWGFANPREAASCSQPWWTSPSAAKSSTKRTNQWPLLQTWLKSTKAKKILKFRATNYSICQLVCGGKLPKNPSLSKSKELQALIQARNEKIQEYLAAPQDPQEGQESFGEQKPSTKKRKAHTMEEPDNFVVTIQLGSTEIPCLAGGQRPSKWDLYVAMEPEPLRQVIGHLGAGCQAALQEPTRGYKGTKKDWSHRWP